MVFKAKDKRTARIRPADTRGILHVVVAYVVASLIWIVVSNWLLWDTSLPLDELRRWHTVRDLLFAALTSVLLFLLVTRLTRELAATGEQFRKANAELEASEKRFHTLFDAATDIILLADLEARLIDVNRRACEALGYTRDELLRLCVMDIQAGVGFDDLTRLWHSEEFGRGVSLRRAARRKDGSTFPVEARINRIVLDGQTYSMAVVRDITEQLAAEASLRAGDEFNRAIFDATTAQMAVVDPDGKLIAVNAAWTAFASEHACAEGQEKRSGLGSNFFDGCCQDCQAESPQARTASAGVRAVLKGDCERFSMESLCETPQRQLWFLMNATPLKAGNGGAVITYLDITEIKAAQRTQSRYTEQLQALARRHQEIGEKERIHLSMELHDHIGQLLAALKITLALARRQIAGQTEAETALDNALGIVENVARTTHDIAQHLRPPLLDELGVKSALAWHISNLPCPENVRVHFEEDIGAARFPQSVELACFRIVQEALTNALRHAGPSEIQVKVYSTPDHLCFSVKDDGKGFDVDIPMSANEEWISLGLIGIRERIAQLGGELRIDSQPNAGTRLSACLPKDTPHESDTFSPGR